jgi:hypothetical protein
VLQEQHNVVVAQVCASQSYGGLENAQVGAHAYMCPHLFSPAEVKANGSELDFNCDSNVGIGNLLGTALSLSKGGHKSLEVKYEENI